MCTKIHYSNQVCFASAARRKSQLITHRWRGSGGGAGSGHRGLAAPAEPRLQDGFKEGAGGALQGNQSCSQKILKMTSQRDANTPNMRVRDTSARRITHPPRFRRLSRNGAAPPPPVCQRAWFGNALNRLAHHPSTPLIKKNGEKNLKTRSAPYPQG